MKRDIFFDRVRAIHGKALSQSQVDVYSLILDGAAARRWADPRLTAYPLGTAYHETAHTMLPVRETLAVSDAAAIRILDASYAAGKLPWVKTPYWRPDSVTGLSYLGRGLVQLTHKANYATAGAKLGLELVHHPELAMVPATAVRILLDGMEQGWFAGDSKGRQTLSRYFRDGVNDPIGARRIINGQDKASEIAGFYRAFLAALTAAA